MAKTRTRDHALRERARQVIPGGMYGHQSVRILPDAYPQFFSRAKGARLWDVDDNEYIDLMCAYGPMLLGYANAEVDAAVAEQLGRGDTLTGPTDLMVELAERFVEIIDAADWALFCKNGTDATTAGLSIARAQTGKQKVLVAKGSYHGAAPWCTPFDAGIVPEARAHLIAFEYGNVESAEAAAREAGDDLAAIIVSPFRHDAMQDQTLPDAGFAKGLRSLCDQREALLILDEVRAGFRLGFGGSWTQFGVEPDLAAWGKCLANGHPLSLLTGVDHLKKAASKVYLTGSFWFQAAPMAAALATLAVLEREPVVPHIETLGHRLRDGWARQAEKHGVAVRQTGPVQMPLMLFDDDPKLEKGNLFAAESVERGAYVHPWHNMFLSAAHTETDIDTVLAATDAGFQAVAQRNGGA